jgi:ketosteroid isomerase-like protein
MKPLTLALLLAAPLAAQTRSGSTSPANPQAAAAIVDADRAFAKSVADKNREAFLSFIADVSTFNGGTPDEIRGRDAVWNEWKGFFGVNGPTLTWEPTHAEVLGSGDLGYSVGRSVTRRRTPDGNVAERRGEYLTVWRKQADGRWKVVFDSGSTLPSN